MKTVHKILPSCTIDDIHMMAKTIYGEARGEITKNIHFLKKLKDENALFIHIQGLVAVGNIIYNRFKKQTWFGKTLSEVCVKPFQFSCWNANDPNRRKVENLKIDSDFFQLCLYVAEGVVNQKWDDITKGADHYHAVWLTPHPRWAKPECITNVIGQHVFYNISEIRGML
ncbi:MAG: hypothetical protein C0432_04395 [Candidatus Puniceispirillum sp.]|nr:hypothetical protein [Candidatus Pelagibacter sp.]MBA4283515.1 hypothetical protein [Candidatus Puniceispirillum sp.]